MVVLEAISGLIVIGILVWQIRQVKRQADYMKPVGEYFKALMEQGTQEMEATARTKHSDDDDANNKIIKAQNEADDRDDNREDSEEPIKVRKEPEAEKEIGEPEDTTKAELEKMREQFAEMKRQMETKPIQEIKTEDIPYKVRTYQRQCFKCGKSYPSEQQTGIFKCNNCKIKKVLR